jgi:predicted dehydrogenase
MNSGMSRRQFVRSAAYGAAGAVLAGRAASVRGVLGANEQLRIAVLGPGDRASGLMDEVVRDADSQNCRIVAVCDLWGRRRDIAAERLKAAKGWEVAKYRNTDELYAAKDIDAVIIGTPDFSHARLCAEAVRNGKDVYVEKPLADVLEDAKLVRETVNKSDRVVQLGTGRRSEGVYIGAARYVQSGEFGKVIAVEMHWNVNQSKRWRRENEVKQLAEDAASGKFDAADCWKRYRLNRPEEPFDPRKYLEFRLFWPYSSGLPDQWMSHQIDTVAMITGDPYPKSCVASGGLCQWKDGRRNPDIFTAVFEYPSGFQVLWTARQNNDAGGTNEVYYSNWGSLNLGTGKITGDGAPDENGSPGSKKLKDMDIPTAGGMEHMTNWLQCCRTRKKPNADIEAGYSHSVAVSMAIQAYQTGKRVTFDPTRHEIVLA